ncbi:hypothetical protein NUH87_30225 [Pseudomonas batumici]|uniref:hypothetical protein n=1 Tax=Pseudomonas batumici TaxID=226910 RepID=UPI0030CC8B37
MSIDFKYQVRAENRLEHIKSHVEGGFDIDRMVDFISTRIGDPRACATGLSSHALASAMLAWFEGHDLELMKNWYYVSAELNRFSYGLEIDTINPLAKKLQLLKPLLSDNSEIIDWFSTKNEASFNVKKLKPEIRWTILPIRRYWRFEVSGYV